MPIEPNPQPATDDLQFEVAEPSVENSVGPAPSAQTCVGCRQPIASTYYAVRDKVVCPSCCQQLNAPPPGSAATRVFKSFFMGLGAGLLGAVIWFAIRRVAHLEVGLVAILVGYMVGKAVRKGSGNRGGVGYQIMAVILTYCCICANYAPDVLEAMQGRFDDDRVPVVIQAIFVAGTSLAVPFLGGVQNILGLLIIGFALLQAWKFNKPRSLAITGPYQIGSPVAGAGV